MIDVLVYCFVILGLSLPEDDTLAPKHVGVLKIYEQFVTLLCVLVGECDLLC